MTGADPATLDLLPDATVLVDGQGIVVAANDLAARLIGVPAKELQGRSAPEAVPLVDEAGADWWTCAAPLAADARLLPRVPEADLLLRTAAGAQRPVTLTGVRIPGEQGSPVLLVLGLRRAERRARMDAMRSELVSTVSHELRSPLTSVRGFTRTLLAKWDRFNDEQKQQMLRTVHEDAERVTRLLGEMLDISRIDAGLLRVARQMVDVGAIVDRVLARFTFSEDEQDRALISLVPADLPTIYADPDKLDQVFTNLVENALRHGAGRVTVDAAVAGQVVAFTVSDEGSGIPWQSRQQVFTKFFRSRGGAGTGLGLFICKGIVDAHGGRIWAHDGEADGGRITFELPLDAAPPSFR
jgi:PAS domain S-box-containing protein